MKYFRIWLSVGVIAIKSPEQGLVVRRNSLMHKARVGPLRVGSERSCRAPVALHYPSSASSAKAASSVLSLLFCLLQFNLRQFGRLPFRLVVQMTESE